MPFLICCSIVFQMLELVAHMFFAVAVDGIANLCHWLIATCSSVQIIRSYHACDVDNFFYIY